MSGVLGIKFLHWICGKFNLHFGHICYDDAMPILFKSKDRTFTGPAENGESHWKYYDRSARPEAAKMRDKVEEMLSNYPEEHPPDLVSRLKSRNNDVFTSAMFELILHEMLIKTGHTILAIEPEISTGDKRPDFLVQAPDGEKFYLEALSYAKIRQDEKAGNSIQNDFRNAANEIDCDYYLDVKITGLPKQHPSQKKFKHALQTWAKDLTNDEKQAKARPFIWESNGLKVVAKALFKKVNTDGRNIGMEFGTPGFVPQDGGLKSALKTKMKKYGELDLPLCIAITPHKLFVDFDECINALFGNSAVTFDPDDIQGSVRNTRDDAGLWRSRAGRYTRCSAVLFFKGLTEWSMAKQVGKLVHHPEARHPLIGSSLPVQSFRLQGEYLESVSDEVPLGECFDLPFEWPE